MVSKLHQVIPWWLPTVLLSQTQSQMTELKNLFKHFCRMRFWFLVPSERGFLTFKFMGTRPWLLILLERLGWSWAQMSLLLSAVFVFRLFSHHGRVQPWRGRSADWQQAGTVPWGRGPSKLTFVILWVPYYHSVATYPFTLSRMWLPACNICVCWLLFLCLQSCWFPVHEHGLEKNSNLSVVRGWADHVIYGCELSCVHVTRRFFFFFNNWLLILWDKLFSLPSFKSMSYI